MNATWSTRHLCLLLTGACVALLGCGKKSQSASEKKEIDACTLISNNEVAQIQDSPIKETKSSAQANKGFRVAQCFYTATEFSKSVVLTVSQRDPNNPGKQTPKQFWIKMFREGGTEGEREREGEEGEKIQPPKKIDGVGDEAYWTGLRFGAALYVLKKDTFIRISVGGADDEEAKLKKTKALAIKAVKRL